MKTATKATIGLADLEDLADAASDIVDLLERFQWEPGQEFPEAIQEQLVRLPAHSVIEPAAWQVLYSLTTGYLAALSRDVRILRDVIAIARREDGSGGDHGS